MDALVESLTGAGLLMHEICVDLWPIFHEIINPDLTVLGEETFAEDFGLKFQSILKAHLCPL